MTELSIFNYLNKETSNMISSHTVSIYTGTCQRATTQEECETIAIQLGLTDTTAGVLPLQIWNGSGTAFQNLEWPPYCYYKPSNPEDEKLWFNANVTENTSPCTGIRKCVCKNGIHISGKIKQELIR